MDTRRIERDPRFLALYAFATTTVLGVLAVSAFTQGQQKAKFTEIALSLGPAEGCLP